VAWAASCYAAWSGDGRFLSGAGAPLVVETARWWADRVELDLDGRGHIRGVMGPDEYHPRVDDNAYTNVMARWNLRQAARLGAGGAPGIARAEARRWVALADALVDGHDPRTGVYEQFAGFHALEPLVIAEIAPRRPVAADLLLGAERVAGAQVVKQADVLMLHHLVPDEVAPETLEANLGFYEPRTAHGSSLSPGVHASLFARAGQLDRALELLRLTARIDLEDLTGTTAGGVHLAAMASVWHALAYGFCGLRAQDDALALDPRLPPEWQTLEIRLRYRRAAVRVRCRHDGTTVWADPPIAVRTPTEGPVVADAAGVGLRNGGDG
jgi:trehalose/maltose hydrolase-like predicted phosphorylase